MKRKRSKKTALVQVRVSEQTKKAIAREWMTARETWPDITEASVVRLVLRRGLGL